MGETQPQTVQDDQLPYHGRQEPGRRPPANLKDDPQVIAAAAQLYEGLLHINAFCVAIGRCKPWVHGCIAQGMPSITIGRRHYIRVTEAREWLITHGTKDRAPRPTGRPLGSKNRPK